MVQDDGHSGEGVGKVSDLVQLRVVEVGIKAESKFVQHRESLPELRVAEQALRKRPGPGHVGAGIEGSDMPHPSEAWGGGQMGFKHPLDRCAKGQVGESDDAGGYVGLAVSAAVVLGHEPLHEFSLAEGLHLLWAVLAVHRLAFNEDGPDDVVAAAQVVVEVFTTGAVVEVDPLPRTLIDELGELLAEALARDIATEPES